MSEPMTFWQPKDNMGVASWLCTPHAIVEMNTNSGPYHFESMEQVVQTYRDLGEGDDGGFESTTDPDTICCACRDGVPLDQSFSEFTVRELLNGVFNG